MKSFKRCWAALPLLFASAVTLATSADTPAPASSGVRAPTDADLAAAHCVIGEERFLPADYYYCLGGYTYGQHNYAESQRFFKTAASWASKPAQYVLGVMALNGDHQPRNRALALAWLTLAAERPGSRFQSVRDELYKASSPSERQAADDLLKTMRPVYADAVAAVRAEQRYAEGMKWLTRMNNQSDGKICLEGMSTLAHPMTDPTHCPPIQQVSELIDKQAITVFDGWAGHVSVGPLQSATAPASEQ